jgi:hypothetical protein
VFEFPGHKRNAGQKTLRFYLTPVRMTIFKNTNVGKDTGKQELYSWRLRGREGGREGQGEREREEVVKLILL